MALLGCLAVITASSARAATTVEAETSVYDALAAVFAAASFHKIGIAHVRLMQQGACVLFAGRPGPVTLVNLVGRRGTYRMGVACGKAIPTGMVFAGNPTKVVLEGGVQHYLDVIAREGLGHHWMIGYGDVRKPLRDLCVLLGIPCVECT